jgi:DNA-binding LacI/PurR family transcriptional regulator
VPDRPTLADVARLSGVSIATASYVLSGQREGRVGEVRSQRVLEAAETLGYRRNPAAMTLHRGYSNVVMIAVAAASLGAANPLPLAEITSAIARQGYTVVTHVDIGSDGVLASARELQPCAVVLLMPLDDDLRVRLGALVPVPLLEWQSPFRDLPRPAYEGLERIAGTWFAEAVGGTTVRPLFDAWVESARGNLGDRVDSDVPPPI